MVFINELFNIPFKPESHIVKGAPRDFYSNKDYQHIRYSNAEMDDFVKERPKTWMRDLTFVEKTVRKPDTVFEEHPKTVHEEFNWNRRIVLKRSFDIKGKLYVCRCVLMNVDGRFCVPLVGRCAPLIEEIP